MDPSPTTDARRFEALYREHYLAVVRYAHRRIDPASAEEVVADTFATAWRLLDDVPADGALPWLYAVAANRLLSARRAAASRRDKAANAALVSSHDRGRDPADAFAERDGVARAFASLSQPDREALRLTAWEGLDHEDAARAAGTSRPAFTKRVSRAKRRLRDALAASEHEHERDDNTERMAAPVVAQMPEVLT